MGELKKINASAKANQLDFLYDLHLNSVDIGESSKDLLRKNGYLKDFDKIKEVVEKHFKDKGFHNDPTVVEGGPSEHDKNIDIIHEVDAPLSEIISDEAYRKLVEEKGSVIFSGKKIEISRTDWAPKSVNEHEQDFIEWIDSINAGFATRGNYRKFNLYCQQAYQWIAENDSLSNYLDYEDRENYKDREIERCAENTLYFLNRYLKLKESTLAAGTRDYKAMEAQVILIYLFDCGYSVYLGKPRQIGATSTLGGCAIAKTMFKRNHFMKFVTESDTKGMEIFEDKIKYPFSEFPEWMRDESRNDSGHKIVLGTKDKKGDRGGTNSNIDVVAPSKTAVSGGTPQVAFIDEAGNISILTQIIEDARPTSFGLNEKTGKMERMRQIFVWGTGGEMERGGKAFERELMNAMKAWKERRFALGVVPLFFDWTSRPGITQEIYDQEKEVAYSKEGAEAEASRILFRQQYPSCIEDMFVTSAGTLVSQEYIATNLNRIFKTKAVMKPKYGYFEPIYGEIEQPEGSDVPFNIIGANFIPLSVGDPRASVTIFQEPKQGWRDRYFQGTDPIASDTGLSNMASSIWDNYYKTISAVVNYRISDYREVFLQTMLLGVYYDWEKGVGVPELIEANIGTAYKEYKTNKGRFDTLVFNTELPDQLKVGNNSGNQVGVDNKGARNKIIINLLTELILAFGEKIYIEIFWLQLKTFVSKATAKGNETWGPIDRKIYKDDVLFSSVFSYICAQCFPLLKPHKMEDDNKDKPKFISALDYDKNYNIIRVNKRVLN